MAIERHISLVQGSSVRSKHAGRDFMAGLKSIFGGEFNNLLLAVLRPFLPASFLSCSYFAAGCIRHPRDDLWLFPDAPDVGRSAGVFGSEEKKRSCRPYVPLQSQIK